VNATAKQQLRRNVANDPYSNPTKTYSVPATTNEDGTLNIPAQPVYLVNPNVEPIPATGAVSIYSTAGAAVDVEIANLLGGLSPAVPALATFALQMYSNPVTGVFENVRTGGQIRTIGLTTAAGDTALWDPAAGKKFRLMAYTIDIAAGTTAAGACLLTLRDNATVIANHTICGGALAASAGRTIANFQLPANGYLSIAADNILNLNLSSVLAAGGVTAVAYGTEE